MCTEEENGHEINRRTFVKRAVLAAGIVTAFGISRHAMGRETTGTAGASKPPKDLAPIPKRKFGKSNEEVSIIGLGGAHIGSGDESAGIRVIHEAIDYGINFMDNAWEYHQGKSEERMGKALASAGRRDKVFLMTKVCTHGRDAKVAMKQLEDSLRRLQTDVIDLWQIHEVAYEDDPVNHFAEGGVTEALLKAREQGKVRYLGFTGHKSPELHKRMLSHDFLFDAVQMPLNPFDASFMSFEKEVLPILNQRGIAAIGMKSLGGSADMVKQKAVTVEEALGYAMSLPVSTVVSGMNSLEVLYQNLQIASGFTPMAQDRMIALARRVEEQASDGKFELYKTTARFEGPEGRKQHESQLHKEMPA